MPCQVQKYWRSLAKAGGCESKAQSVAVRLFLNQARDGSIDLNDKDAPIGRDYRLVAKLLNEMGLRTKTGMLWKETRTQQVIINGLARQAVFFQLHQLKLRGRSLDAALEEAEAEMWRLFQRKQRTTRNGTKTSYGTKIVNGEAVVCDRPPLSEQYWAKKKAAARERGWRPPERWFTPPPEEKYEEGRRDY
jgi:hypothetical protein